MSWAVDLFKRGSKSLGGTLAIGARRGTTRLTGRRTIGVSSHDCLDLIPHLVSDLDLHPWTYVFVLVEGKEVKTDATIPKFALLVF